MQLSASQLAKLLNGTVEGDPNVFVGMPSPIEVGGEGTISFLGNPKYEPYVYTTSASILLVGNEFVPRQPVKATLIRVDNVYSSIALLTQQFGQGAKGTPVISGKADLHETANIGAGVNIGPFTVISAGARIGNQVWIHEQVFIGPNAEIGDHSVIFPGVRILKDCKIGKNCIIQANAVIGADGFGFAPQEDGSYRKIQHLGNVVLEDWVEIGANTTIDRATLGSTIIRKGVKLDNLIQVAHNVEIGENTVIAAQAGIAGSTKIGENCRIGGQAGFAGHLKIAPGTQVQAQSGLASNIETPGTALFGSPAIPYNDYIRAYAVFKKLPEIYRQIHQLQKAITPDEK